MCRPLNVGLTGGLASGKSVVLTVMEQAGAHVTRADELARDAMRRGTELHQAIARELGPDSVTETGELDREYLASKAFSTPEIRARLEQLVHPVVMQRQQAILAELTKTPDLRVAVFEAAVLIETGHASDFDVLVVVACTPEQQLERAVARGMDGADAKARIEAQGPVSYKLALADIVIDSGGTLAETQAQARTVYQQLLLNGEDKL